MRFAALFASAMALGATAEDSTPVRQIDIYVQPFYTPGKPPGSRPTVAVGAKFDALLASNDKADIVAARDLILAQPQLVTPMTLMVLAIRLYDMGLRDDAVVWFYVARDRYTTLSDVILVETPRLAQVEEAIRNFSALVGPYINGYAFCNLERQREARLKAIAWVEANPYQAVFMENLPPREGERADNLRKSVESLKVAAEKERKYLADPKVLAEFRQARAANRIDARFCWTR